MADDADAGNNYSIELKGTAKAAAARQDAIDAGNNITVELKGTIKSAPPAKPKDDDVPTILLKATINLNKPATPGDINTSEVIPLPSDTTTKADKPTLLRPTSANIPPDYISSCKRQAHKDTLEKWNGKETYFIYKRCWVDDDIVPAASLPDKPRWLVRVNAYFDEKAKSAADKRSVRLNACLSFNETECQTLPYKGWINKPADGRKAMAVIGQDILDCDELKIKEYIANKYITASTSRIPVGEIEEGTWYLPVFFTDASGTPCLVAYIKVVIEWVAVADDAKTAAK